MTSAGLEPAIPGSVGRCLIHWATRPVVDLRARRLNSPHPRRLPTSAHLFPCPCGIAPLCCSCVVLAYVQHEPARKRGWGLKVGLHFPDADLRMPGLTLNLGEGSVRRACFKRQPEKHSPNVGTHTNCPHVLQTNAREVRCSSPPLCLGHLSACWFPWAKLRTAGVQCRCYRGEFLLGRSGGRCACDTPIPQQGT